MIKRLLRRFTVAVGGMLAGAVLAGAATTSADARTLTFADSFPAGHYLSEHAMKIWMKRVEELTNGEIDWTYFPAGQIAKAKGTLTAVRDGRIDAAYVGISYFADKLPLNTVSMLPGMTTSSSAGSPAYWQLLKDDTPLREEFLKNNSVPVFGAMIDPYQMVMATGPLMTPEDFKGKKIRSAGGAMNLTLERLGAIPVAMPAPDMYVAMERGIVDGTLFSVNSIKPYRVNELAKSLSRNGSFGTFVFSIAVNKATFDSLSPEIQKAFIQAGDDTVKHLSSYVDESVGKNIEEFAKEGIEIYDFPPETMKVIDAALGEAEQDWVDRIAARGLPAEAVLTEFKKAMGE